MTAREINLKARRYADYSPYRADGIAEFAGLEFAGLENDALQPRQHADSSDDDDDEQLTPTAASASVAASVPGAPAAADTPLRCCEVCLMFVGTDRRLCLGALRTRTILRELCASRSGRGWDPQEKTQAWRLSTGASRQYLKCYQCIQ